MIPEAFDYESPTTLGEALELLAGRNDAKLLAGGHSLLPTMKLRLASPPLLVDLGRIAGLNNIHEAHGQVVIGAMTNHAEVAGSRLLRDHCPLLPLTAARIGDIQVRNRGTIGGSLAQAHPSADYPAAILALDAEIVAVSKDGPRVIPARDFFQGMFTTALQPHEILTEVRVPRTNGAGAVYKKFEHPASGYAVVGVAALLRTTANKIESAAVGITGVGHIAYRATAVEDALRGKPLTAIPDAAKLAADGVEALGDTYASGEYRRHLAAVLTLRALQEAVTRKRNK